MPNAPDAFNESYKTGPNLTAGIGLPLFPFTEGIAAVRYDRFALDGEAYSEELGMPNISVDGGTLSVFSGSFNVKISPPMLAVSPYFIGGLGVYRMTAGDLTVSGAGTLEFESETNLGANFGVGLTFDLVPLIGLFVEPQYVIIFEEGDDTTYYPIRAGLVIGL